MLDPITTPLLLYVLGRLGEELIAEACKDYLKDRLKDLFGWLAGFGRKDDLARAYEAALQDAMTLCLEMLLKNLEALGHSRDELKAFEPTLKTFLREKIIAEELLEAIKDPLNLTYPSADTMAARWQALGGPALDRDAWTGMAKAFRRHANKQAFVNDAMREVLNAQNLDRVRELIERTGGVRPDVHPAKYALRMRTKYSPVDLANLMPAHAGDPGQLVIRDVFVPQQAKENPPAVELPKDLLRRLDEEDGHKPTADEAERYERLVRDYASQKPRKVLELIAEPQSRLLMLTGDPGSGKSTLLRYLLLGVLEPPLNANTGELLPWTVSFRTPPTFPLLIELRDFHATRARHDDIDTFLDYVLFLGRTEQYFLDDHWLHDTLEAGPSLVMFDGLDEIFDRRDREKVMQEIVGFAQRYPKARIVVTSRPIGYRDTILRQADFRHFALQDLDTEQVETFVRGWFALTFPQQPDLASQRFDRVLSGVRRFASIRLLAGNPMLLTIMVLLAREQELPRERAAFYEAAVSLLCHQWDANRNLALPDTDYLHLEDKKELLRRIALHMQTGNGGLAGNAIHEQDLEAEAEAWFKTRFRKREDEAIQLARKLIAQLRERNYILCLRGPRLYGFVHRTFLEYLTATDYVTRFRDAQELTETDLLTLYDIHAEDDDWREVLRLIAGQAHVQVVEKIITRLINSANDGKEVKNRISILTLSIQCLGEARAINQLESIGKELFTAVIDALSSDQIAYFGSIEVAAQEVGTLWPGVDESMIKKIDFGKISDDSFSMGAITLPRFLAAIYPDPELQFRLANSANGGIRVGALETLARKTPNHRTRKLLLEKINEKDEVVSAISLELMASQWPDISTRKLLQTIITQETRLFVLQSAFQSLARHWPDNDTRSLLLRFATTDANEGADIIALQTLADNWPDADTRDHLHQIAVENANDVKRGSSLQILASTWSDTEAINLLRQRASNDLAASVRGIAAHQLGKTHSHFGELVFTQDLDGIEPFLDPHQSLSTEHIENAARRTGISPHEVPATVAKLNQYLGWNISEGLRPTT